MGSLMDRFAEDPEYLLGLIGIISGVVIVLTIGTLISVTTIRNRRAMEQSRREIAAYVAEGTMTAEDAEHLLHPSPWYARGAKNVGKKIRGFNPEMRSQA